MALKGISLIKTSTGITFNIGKENDKILSSNIFSNNFKVDSPNTEILSSNIDLNQNLAIRYSYTDTDPIQRFDIYNSVKGTASVLGSSSLTLGNNITQGAPNNAVGHLSIYGPETSTAFEFSGENSSLAVNENFLLKTTTSNKNILKLISEGSPSEKVLRIGDSDNFPLALEGKNENISYSYKSGTDTITRNFFLLNGNEISEDENGNVILRAGKTSAGIIFEDSEGHTIGKLLSTGELQVTKINLVSSF